MQHTKAKEHECLWYLCSTYLPFPDSAEPRYAIKYSDDQTSWHTAAAVGVAGPNPRRAAAPHRRMPLSRTPSHADLPHRTAPGTRGQPHTQRGTPVSSSATSNTRGTPGAPLVQHHVEVPGQAQVLALRDRLVRYTGGGGTLHKRALNKRGNRSTAQQEETTLHCNCNCRVSRLPLTLPICAPR